MATLEQFVNANTDSTEPGRETSVRSREQIPVFPVVDGYLFKHYFESDELFRKIYTYYNHEKYRFEVPHSRFDSVETTLWENGYDLEIIDDTEKFIVAVEKYNNHPWNVFRHSVVKRGTRDHNCFLMANREAVDIAISHGAKPLTETDIENPFRAN